MTTLIAIFAHGKSRDTLCRHWAHFERAKSPFLVIQPENLSLLAPVPPGHGRFAGTLTMGHEPYIEGESHVITFLSAIKALLDKTYPGPWEQLCLTEYDALFFRPPPALKGPGIMSTLVGFRSPGFRGSRYFHAPWLMQRNTVEYVFERGMRMAMAGLDERGMVDRFLGLMMDLWENIPHLPSDCYSKNTIDTLEWIAEARAAVKAGAWHVHGVKTQPVFEELTKGL